MKPICVPCQRFYRPKKNGVYFLEGMPEANAQPGTLEPEKWKDYKIWNGDLWECEGCKHQLISGVGNGPISEHYMKEHFAHCKTFVWNNFRVNDC